MAEEETNITTPITDDDLDALQEVLRSVRGVSAISSAQLPENQ